MGRVDGKVALITGAASGLGLESARLLAKEGAKIVLTDINEKDGKTAASEIGGDSFFIKHDVTSEEQWISVIDQTMERFGTLDVLVNSAGMGVIGDIEHTSFDDWKKVHAVNLDSVFLGCKYGIKAMKKENGGSIINLSSVSGLIGGYNMAAYNSSKGGVRLLSKSVALYCARKGYNIRCNSVHPSFILTPMVEQMIDAAPDPVKAKSTLERQLPIGRLGQPTEVAHMILYLASDESPFVTGSEMVIDGGITAQ
ncbi:MAG: glucose 1-dehydrogenase [Alphaproteobacteria bacterium]|nr:glucose 1-dehydrogenase [Alphaproteobacteria bacterium]